MPYVTPFLKYSDLSVKSRQHRQANPV